MNKNLTLGLEELISSAIEKSVANAFRKEKLNLKKETPFKKIGGIDLAVEITGLAKPTIYAMTSKNTIPFLKRGGKLYFKTEDLQNWIEKEDSSKTDSND